MAESRYPSFNYFWTGLKSVTQTGDAPPEAVVGFLVVAANAQSGVWESRTFDGSTFGPSVDIGFTTSLATEYTGVFRLFKGASGHIFAYNSDGEMAYTADGGASWTQVDLPSGLAHVGWGPLGYLAHIDANFPGPLSFSTGESPWTWTAGSSADFQSPTSISGNADRHVITSYLDGGFLPSCLYYSSDHTTWTAVEDGMPGSLSYIYPVMYSTTLATFFCCVHVLSGGSDIQLSIWQSSNGTTWTNSGVTGLPLNEEGLWIAEPVGGYLPLLVMDSAFTYRKLYFIDLNTLVATEASELPPSSNVGSAASAVVGEVPLVALMAGTQDVEFMQELLVFDVSASLTVPTVISAPINVAHDIIAI